MAEAPHHIECSICLAYVNPDEDKLVNLVKCGHVFHKDCIEMWFSSGLDNRKPCPQCRIMSCPADIKPIYLQLVKDEESEEMKKELQKVREQLREEKRKKMDKTIDPMVDSLVNLTAKMRLAEACTAQRAIFMPNCRHYLFEGCQGVEDTVKFSVHNGNRNWHHRRGICWKPELIVESALGRDTIHNSLMSTIFAQQLELVRKTYDKDKDGRLELTVKFGQVYVHQKPAENVMLVRDFNFGITQMKKSPKAICTSFAPTETSPGGILDILTKAGFRETKREDVVVVNVEHSKNKPRIIYEVYLDEQLNFRSLRKNDRSFINIDIQRKDPQRADIRMAVKSVDEEFQKDNLRKPELQYAKDKLVRWDNNPVRKLLIDRSVIGKISYARHKVMRIFKLASETSSNNALEKLVEVKVMEVTSFEEPQFNGTFKNRKYMDEVYIQIHGKDDLYRACDDDQFLQKLITFCDKFQRV